MRRIVTSCALFVTLILSLPSAVNAGPLSPPDPPAPTMKTIDEAAPGVPLTRADIPLTITESGYYYFTEDLIVPAGVDRGIHILAHNVTIDLRGFTLYGPGKDSLIGNTSGIGPTNLSLARNTRVMNGTVDGFNRNGVSVSNNSTIENVHARNIRDTGLFGYDGSVIRRCRVTDSGSDSITSRAISGNGLTVEDNIITNCTGYHAIISAYGGTVRRNRIEDCTILSLGPVEEDLSSVDVGEIPVIISGGTIVEDNLVLDWDVPDDSRWNATIFGDGRDRVAGNSIVTARRGRAFGIIVGPSGNVLPTIENNLIQSHPNANVDLQVGIWAHVAGARISGNSVAMSRQNENFPKRMDGILVTGAKNMISDNMITIDRRVDNHAGIRVLTGRNMITGNRISSLSVPSLAALVSLSFEGDGSSSFSTNYYGGNIMEGIMFDEAGAASNNISGNTPAPNVLF